MSSRLTLLAGLFRINKPIPILFLFFPCLWGFSLNLDKGHALDRFVELFLTPNVWIFLIASVFIRTAGCIVNDCWDKDIDFRVDRTKNRPITAGKISRGAALFYAFLFFLICFFILLTLPMTAILFGVFCFLVTIFYPLVKRYSHIAQFILGLAFGAGGMMAWLSAGGNFFSITGICIYMTGIFWVVGCDTFYAFQDIRDDKKIGLKSTATLIEKNAIPLFLFVFSICIFSLLIIGWSRSTSVVYFFILFILSVFWIKETISFKKNNHQNATLFFNRNILIAGHLIWLACFFSY